MVNKKTKSDVFIRIKSKIIICRHDCEIIKLSSILG